jgi:hypothetical protein
MLNANFLIHCSLHQTLAPLLQTVLMGTNKWHNADFLAAMMVVVAVVAAAAAEVAMVVIAPVAVVPVGLSLHSRVLTCLHICNPKIIRKKKYDCRAVQQECIHAHV